MALDDKQCHMRTIGTAHLVEIMDDYDLLPMMNFRYGQPPRGQEAGLLGLEGSFHAEHARRLLVRLHPVLRPRRGQFRAAHRPLPRATRSWSTAPNTKPWPAAAPTRPSSIPDAVLEINFYCDTYGIDTISFGTLTAFIMDCYENGILNKERTGGLEMTWGNWRGGPGADAPDGPRRGVRPDRRQGRQIHAGVLRRRTTAPTPSSSRTSACTARDWSSRNTSPRSRWPSRAATT